MQNQATTRAQMFARSLRRDMTDGKRDEFFRQQGFEVVRFPANLPFTDLQALLQAIHNRAMELADAPIPTFPQRGKEL